MDAFTTGVDSETGGADCKNPWGALNVAFGCFLPKATFEALRLQPLIFEVGILSMLFVCLFVCWVGTLRLFLLGCTQLVLLLLA